MVGPDSTVDSVLSLILFCPGRRSRDRARLAASLHLGGPLFTIQFHFQLGVHPAGTAVGLVVDLAVPCFASPDSPVLLCCPRDLLSRPLFGLGFLFPYTLPSGFPPTFSLLSRLLSLSSSFPLASDCSRRNFGCRSPSLAAKISTGSREGGHLPTSHLPTVIRACSLPSLTPHTISARNSLTVSTALASPSRSTLLRPRFLSHLALILISISSSSLLLVDHLLTLTLPSSISAGSRSCSFSALDSRLSRFLSRFHFLLVFSVVARLVGPFSVPVLALLFRFAGDSTRCRSA